MRFATLRTLLTSLGQELDRLESPGDPMSTYSFQITTTDTPLDAGKTFNHIDVTVTDRSGATLDPVRLTGSESPPWSGSVQGASGDGKASALVQAVDVDGSPLGDAFTLNEAGGSTGTTSFPLPTGGTLSVSA